jgi:dTMP kinase
VARGVFITFEGGEGLGKSTQIALLARRLKRLGLKIFVTREPGGTQAGEKLRKILKQDPLHPLAEVFILEASRAQLVETVLKPHLKKGFVVICDRFQESTLVYQGLVRGVDLKFIRAANQMATGGLKPDRILLLDGGRPRLKGRSKRDKFDRAGDAFHRKTRKAYLKLARQGGSWRVFNAQQDRLTLHEQIFQDVKSLVWKYSR